MSNSTASPPRPLIKSIFWGLVAGILAGLTMLLTMALLRLLFGWPTPTELIFDRLFPLLTVEFFIGSLVKAGGYTPLKLQGVYSALTGQLAVAGIGGVIYALYLRPTEKQEQTRWRLAERFARLVAHRSWRRGSDIAIHCTPLADTHHELPRLSASKSATNRIAGNADLVQHMRIGHRFLLRLAGS